LAAPEVHTSTSSSPVQKEKKGNEEDFDFNEEIVARFRQLGLFYTHPTEDEFMLWLKHLPHTKAHAFMDSPKAIRLEWNVHPPEDAVFTVPGIRASEVAASITDTTIILNPPKPLSSDRSRIRQFRYPPQGDAQWLIIAFPFRTPEEEKPQESPTMCRNGRNEAAPFTFSTIGVAG
jgi:hypothetical protein